MQLHYKSFGSGQPFIILHGLFGMLDNWQTIARDLSQHYLMYLMDHRNHGRSEHSDEMDYRLMAGDLRETMESQWLYDGAIVMGHSMGGKTAMRFALQEPDMVKYLIIVDIAPIAYEGGHESIIEALEQIEVGRVASRKEVEEQLYDRVKDPDVVLFLMKNLSRAKSGGYQWKMNLEGIARNYGQLMEFDTEQCVPFEGPTLFIRGGDSDYITDQSLAPIKHWFPNSQVTTVEGAGHWIHAEKPEEIKNMIRTFLQQPI